MPWFIKYRAKKRIGKLSIGIALTIPILLSMDWGGRCSALQVISWIIVAVGLYIIGYVLFCPLRKEIPPIPHLLKKSKTVWGLWFTGDRMMKEIMAGNGGAIKRILLLAPDSEAFKKNLEITGADDGDTKRDIRKLTQKATERGISVRWYSRHEGFSLTLYDPLDIGEPSSRKARCVVQILIPNVPREDRPLHMGGRQPREDVGYFNGKLIKFKEIWDSKTLSRKPDANEYEEKS